MICKIFQTQTNKTNNLVTRVTNSIVSADSLVGDVGGLTQSNHQMFIKCFIKFLMLCTVRLKLIFEKYFHIFKCLEQLKLVVNWLTNKLLFSVDCKIKAILVENCLSFAVRHFLPHQKLINWTSTLHFQPLNYHTLVSIHLLPLPPWSLITNLFDLKFSLIYFLSYRVLGYEKNVEKY